MSLPTRTRQKRKSPSKEAKQEMDQQTTGFVEGLDKLQQEAVVHVSPLPAQPPRLASSQSITGSITGERPCSRALSEMGTDQSSPQSMPPLADHHQQLRISDTPQVPFQKLSQNSRLHLSQLSVPLFTEDRYNTSTHNDQDNCNAEITTITRWWMPSHATTMVMSPPRPVSTPSTVDYLTQGDPNQMAPQGNYGYNQSSLTTQIQNTNNYLIPDGSDRSIHDIRDKTFHIGILENGHNAYLVELPDLITAPHQQIFNG